MLHYDALINYWGFGVLGFWGFGASGLQPVVRTRHELPHAAGLRLAIDRLRLKSRLGDRQVDQVLRHALFSQNPLDHRLVVAAALEGVQQRLWPFCVFAKKLMYVAT